MDDYMMKLSHFSDILLEDHFFDSLRQDYPGFDNWFSKKARQGEKAFTIYDNSNALLGFLYLKIETGPITDIIPHLHVSRIIKVGTFKINAHGTKIGERCIKKIMDFALTNEISSIYITTFPKQEGLIKLLQKFGFSEHGQKGAASNKELVFVKQISAPFRDPVRSYPLMPISQAKHYLLSILPQYHTRLFPDSILNNETYESLEDTAHTNSIHKIYICRMRGVERLKQGDSIVVYRTSDAQGAAFYRSVATSLCCVEEISSKKSFHDVSDYIRYCNQFSIFSERELRSCWNWSNLKIIKMTYNLAFRKRITNGSLIQDVGLTPDYWGFFELTTDQLKAICQLGGVNESLVINSA